VGKSGRNSGLLGFGFWVFRQESGNTGFYVRPEFRIAGFWILGPEPEFPVSGGKSGRNSGLLGFGFWVQPCERGDANI